MELTDKICVITGAARGIGLATAEALIEAGARAVLADVDAGALDDARRRLPDGRALAVPTDVREPASHASLAARAVDWGGSIDVWINNAGLARHRAIVDYTEDELDWMSDVNLKGTVLGCQQALRHMRERRSGHIVNVVSTAGLRGIAGESFYCATKWAVRGFTEALCEEARPHGVRVTAVLPGGVDTEFWDHAVEREVDRERLLRPRHVADAIVAVLRMDDWCATREIVLRSLADGDSDQTADTGS